MLYDQGGRKAVKRPVGPAPSQATCWGGKALETSQHSPLFICLSYSSLVGRKRAKVYSVPRTSVYLGSPLSFWPSLPNQRRRKWARALLVSQQQLIPLSLLSEDPPLHFSLQSRKFSHWSMGRGWGGGGGGGGGTARTTAVCAETFRHPAPTQFGLLKFKIPGPCISKPGLGKVPKGNAWSCFERGKQVLKGKQDKKFKKSSVKFKVLRGLQSGVIV